MVVISIVEVGNIIELLEDGKLQNSIEYSKDTDILYDSKNNPQGYAVRNGQCTKFYNAKKEEMIICEGRFRLSLDESTGRMIVEPCDD
ncbi:hypothetical protein KY308_00555 [Candidatus Woesearchaeota archaeon]|nr:hypothetical protein [Candidatus Woesearchaeota archaeon]